MTPRYETLRHPGRVGDNIYTFDFYRLQSKWGQEYSVNTAFSRQTRVSQHAAPKESFYGDPTCNARALLLAAPDVTLDNTYSLRLQFMEKNIPRTCVFGYLLVFPSERTAEDSSPEQSLSSFALLVPAKACLPVFGFAGQLQYRRIDHSSALLTVMPRLWKWDQYVLEPVKA